MNQSEKSISKRKKLSRFRVYKPVGNPVVPELFQEKKFPLELDPVLGLILAEANIAHLLHLPIDDHFGYRPKFLK